MTAMTIVLISITVAVFITRQVPSYVLRCRNAFNPFIPVGIPI